MVTYIYIHLSVPLIIMENSTLVHKIQKGGHSDLNFGMNKVSTGLIWDPQDQWPQFVLPLLTEGQNRQMDRRMDGWTNGQTEDVRLCDQLCLAKLIKEAVSLYDRFLEGIQFLCLNFQDANIDYLLHKVDRLLIRHVRILKDRALKG